MFSWNELWSIVLILTDGPEKPFITEAMAFLGTSSDQLEPSVTWSPPLPEPLPQAAKPASAPAPSMPCNRVRRPMAGTPPAPNERGLIIVRLLKDRRENPTLVNGTYQNRNLCRP